MPQTGWMVVGILLAAGGLIFLSFLIRTSQRRPFGWLRRVLDIPIGLPRLRREEPAARYYAAYPPRLSLNVPALVLGPIWYLLAGLWVHASIQLMIVGLSGGLLTPFVWLYCGLKANEDLLEFRVARDSVY